MGAPEIADRLGLARPQVVHNWRYRHADFPKPLVELGQAWFGIDAMSRRGWLQPVVAEVRRRRPLVRAQPSRSWRR